MSTIHASHKIVIYSGAIILILLVILIVIVNSSANTIVPTETQVDAKNTATANSEFSSVLDTPHPLNEEQQSAVDEMDFSDIIEEDRAE